VVKCMPYLSKSKALSAVESSLPHLLGGESSPQYLAYRGDKRIANDECIPWTIGLFLNADPSYGNVDAVGLHSLSFGTLSSTLTMDRTAAEAIHLLPPRNGGESYMIGGNRNNNSLYGVLNQCLTKMGGRLLEVWLRQPLVDLDEIVKRQSVVGGLVDDGIGRDRLREEGLLTLKGLDVDKLAIQLGNQGLSVGSTHKALECLYNVYLLGDQYIPKVMEVLQPLAQQAEDGSSLRHMYNQLEVVHQELMKAVALAEHVIDFDAAPSEFLLSPNLNPELADIRSELNAIDEDLQQIHDDMNEEWANISGQQNQVRLEDVDSNSNTSCVWQFRLPQTKDLTLLQQQADVRIHKVLKNGVYFSTKELEQLGSNKKDKLEEYKEKQSGLVQSAMATASTFTPVLERASAVLSELDVLASFAYVAGYSQNGYCMPEMTDGEDNELGIELKGARHPCVELQEGMDFIPNDFNLVFGESSFLLVTGPNMGGKSTFIRSLGAIVTMAQIGSFVPCTSAKINIVHHILARVGAGDAQDRGISTFMAEMLEASSILRTSTKRSLIIIDELGRGTSTFDGFGLAKAISEYIIHNIGCICVFATHFHELTALEEQEKSVSNCHVSAQSDQNGLTFLYEVRPGPCLESFGIAVAEQAGMPQNIIADAKQKAKQLENFDYRSRKPDGGAGEEEATEETSRAMEFLHKFRNLPIDKMSKEEIEATVMPLLKQYGFQPGCKLPVMQ